MNKNFGKFLRKYFKNRINFAIFACLLIALVVTRFADLETRSVFGYDQVDNAWAVKNIIIDGDLPSTGMQAKGNTGFYIGPYYYYYLVPFYFLSGMDPIASPIAAGVTAIFTFLVIYFVTRNLFNEKVALVAIFINTFSSYILILDRVQWPVNFIVPISFLVMLSLYRSLQGQGKYMPLLAASIGASLHVHFTSVFYFIFVVLSLPFISLNKKMIKYLLLSLPVFVFFLFPIVIAYVNSRQGSAAASYLGSSFHGFHLRRVFQLIKDAVIESNAILGFKNSHLLSFILIPLSIFVVNFKKIKRDNLLISYLFIIWILVPWFAFSTYSGELTNYYFAITRPVAILSISIIAVKLLSFKRKYMYVILTLIGILYIYFNMQTFLNQGPQTLLKSKISTMEKINKGERIEFVQGDPHSYLYFYYKELPKK